MAAMSGLEATSLIESLVEMQVNEAINRNNAMAQTSQGVGRE
jgi:hypothetical protein